MAEFRLEDTVRIKGEPERVGRVYRIAYASDRTIEYHVLIAVTADEIEHETTRRGIETRT